MLDIRDIDEKFWEAVRREQEIYHGNKRSRRLPRITIMNKLFAGIMFLVLAGCSSSTSQYYEAVEKAAAANAAASQAKFEALSKIAAAGDGQAASAAVMALALTQTPTITPVPQQSQALQWASILAAPVSNLGMMWMQTDSTKTMAKYNAQVDLARISADATTQQALYGSFVASNATTADVALGGFNAMGNIDYTPFIDGMVTLGSEGMSGMQSLGEAGLASTVAVADSGIAGIVDMGNAGISGIAGVANTGFESIVTLEQSDNELIEALMSQYNATINNFINNPLTNTSVTETTTNTNTVCSTTVDGVVVTVACD